MKNVHHVSKISKIIKNVRMIVINGVELRIIMIMLHKIRVVWKMKIEN